MEVLGRKGIPVGCRGGGCGICKVRIVEGPYRTAKMSRSCVSEQEQSEGYALACRLFADGDLQLRVVGKMARAFEGSDSTFRFSAHRFQRAEGNNQEE
jgi:ferredoxin